MLMASFATLWACGGQEAGNLFGADGSGGASSSTTGAGTTGTTTTETATTGTTGGPVSTTGSAGSATTSATGGSGGQGGTGTGGAGIGGSGGQRDGGMTAGADGGRDASRTDAACISSEGGPCGGFVLNPCRCADGLVCVFSGVPDAPGTCRRRDAGSDGGFRSCVAPCDRCLRGVCCGNTCCGTGEWCDRTSGVPTCRCGNGPACVMPNTCQPFGPGMPNGCGAICCSTSCPQ
jgi:hypothetical protein